MFGRMIRYLSTKPKPNAEHHQSYLRHSQGAWPLTVGGTLERVKEVGLRGLSSKRHMKIVLRWMRERQKLRLICSHVGPHKQFLYTTWFTKPNIRQSQTRPVNRYSTTTTTTTSLPVNNSSTPKSP